MTTSVYKRYATSGIIFVRVWAPSLSMSNQVAMCIAPLLHKSLSMALRCETALTGFITMDLFSMLAGIKCYRNKLPKGSQFMASQTQHNLQACALAAIVITLTKGQELDPWRRGFARLSELAIEQHFGHLRGQSQNSQLTCRGYWQASARSAMKAAKNLDKENPLPGTESPLTDEEFLDSTRPLYTIVI